MWCACVFVGVSVSSSTSAYILPTEQVLKQFVEHCKTLQDASIDLKQGSAPFTEKRMHLKRGELFRMDGCEPAEACVLYQTWAAFVTARGKTSEDFLIRTLQLLKKHKIDTHLITYTFWNEAPVYVIGAHPWETHKPQLWIDKQLGVPVKIVLLPSNTAQSLTLKAYDETSCIPKAWEFSQGIAWTTQKTHLNTHLPDSLFAASSPLQ